jgi:tetraacyldisaccharide 4'-kinase
VRNWLYDRNWLASHRFEVPTIVVGNLTVGGTGKTPHTEYLIELLKDRLPLAVLSRGYGRKTKGFLLADESATARRIGDEPMQFYRKFGRQITVAVGEDRVAAIQGLTPGPSPSERGEAPPQPSPKGREKIAPPPWGEAGRGLVVLLDDAFQHRAVRPWLALLLTDYNRLFYKDFMLPTGNLRETRRGARRADALIVSKCPPDLQETERQQIMRHVRRYARLGVPIFFTAIRYNEPVFFHGTPPITGLRFLLVSGIAQPRIFEAYAKQNFVVTETLAFADHHDYTTSDVAKIAETCRRTGADAVLTTEKDFVKLHSLALPADVSFCYLPIGIEFLFGEKRVFDEFVLGGLPQPPPKEGAAPIPGPSPERGRE